MKKILVLGCGGSAGITHIKALRMAPEPFYIVGVDVNQYYIEMSPVDKRYLVKHNNSDKVGYIDKINKIIKLEEIEFIHAQPDPEVQILSDNRERVLAKIFLPSKSAISISHDKWLTYETLNKASIPVAKTIKIKNATTLKHVFDDFKDTIWLRASHGAGGKASLPVRSFEHAKGWIEYWVEKGLRWTDFLASELLTGTEVSWLSVWSNGELICSQGKQRLEWVQAGLSPSGVTGTTAIQKTVSNDKVNEVGTLTVTALDQKPNGIYVVDTKENKNGISCVTEINPGRFFTTSLFYPTAGVNMPYIYTKLAYKEGIPSVSKYNSVRPNIYWMRVPDGGPVMVEDGKWTSIIM